MALPTLSYLYNTANQLVRVTDNIGNYISYGYDARGNWLQEYTYDAANTLVRQIDLGYDLRNRVNAINTAGALTQQLHDALGNLVQSIDPRANPATTHSYDALNRLLQTVNALGGATRYGYDVNDRLQQVVAPNSATTDYQYDDLGNLLQEVSADRGPTRYTYDAAGNVKTLTDARGITVRYSYDALNRVTLIGYPNDAENVSFTYDTGANCTSGIGRLCRVQDESGVSEYGYDPFGNLTAQVKSELGVRYTTGYTHDAADRVLSVTYPDGRLLTYTRDSLGRIQGMRTNVNGTEQTIVSGRAYRADGRLTGQTFGNGMAEARAYNLRGELTSQFVGGADTRVYDYDLNGNLARKQSLPEEATYAYDALDRLTATARDAGSDAYGYDANGNRLSDARGSYRYLDTTNRLSATPAGSITLDPAGNLIQDAAGRTFTYHGAGHLASVRQRGTLLATYAYNAQRQRTRKTSAPGGTVYHYDLNGNLIQETHPTGKLIRSYLWADNTPLAQIDLVLKSGRTPPPRLPRARLPEQATVERILYLHTDHQGTPRLATNSAGVKTWSWEGTAFGSTAPNQDPDGDGVNTVINLRFPGQYYDAESGLHYNWNRYYDPRTGRYLSSDPAGLDGGFNTYSYVNNNPLRWVDPEGMQATAGTAPANGFPISKPVVPNPGTSALTEALGKAVPGLLGQICAGVTLFIYTSPHDPNVAACDNNPTSCPMYNKPPENAYDPNGPKAPGKPGSSEGFEDPKGGAQWAPNPNGTGNGWLDSDGNVWVPTGPSLGKAHGGPHWDVQLPGGGHVNVYPGGKRR